MTKTEITNIKSLISVVVEGYNESLARGAVKEIMTALKNQTFPLKQVEVVLVGSRVQCIEWEKMYFEEMPFFGVTTLAANTSHIFELKNKGALKSYLADLGTRLMQCLLELTEKEFEYLMLLKLANYLEIKSRQKKHWLFRARDAKFWRIVAARLMSRFGFVSV